MFIFFSVGSTGGWAIWFLKEVKKYGYWSPDVSRVVCLTGSLIIKYDDSIGLIEEGTFDELAKGYKWKENDRLKLIKTSIEEIAGTSIYNLR